MGYMELPEQTRLILAHSKHSFNTHLTRTLLQRHSTWRSKPILYSPWQSCSELKFSIQCDWCRLGWSRNGLHWTREWKQSCIFPAPHIKLYWFSIDQAHELAKRNPPYYNKSEFHKSRSAFFSHPLVLELIPKHFTCLPSFTKFQSKYGASSP